MIPEFDENGNLPPGVNFCEWEDFKDKFGTNKSKIAEYKRLINCENYQDIHIKIESFNKLPYVLIKARITAKMTHQELAEILGIEEAIIRQYEDTDYQCASFVEILEVITVLGVV